MELKLKLNDDRKLQLQASHLIFLKLSKALQNGTTTKPQPSIPKGLRRAGN